ncbi:MAG: hypothetical protein J7621_22460, partial [Niastella sp.]|nr:hypothetical protein [Niastella sp.]
MMVAISLNRDYFFVKDYLDGTIEDIAFAQKLISFIKYILASRHIGCTKNNALFREVTLKVNIGIIMTNLACKEAHTLVTYIEEKTQKKYDDLREPLEKIVDTTNEENLKLLTQ